MPRKSTCPRESMYPLPRGLQYDVQPTTDPRKPLRCSSHLCQPQRPMEQQNNVCLRLRHQLSGKSQSNGVAGVQPQKRPHLQNLFYLRQPMRQRNDGRRCSRSNAVRRTFNAARSSSTECNAEMRSRQCQRLRFCHAGRMLSAHILIPDKQTTASG